MIKAFGAVALIAALVFVGSAAASRPTTKSEAKAIRLALLHDRVVSARISTRDPRYAAATLPHGVAILHRTFSTWWSSASGSSLPCAAAPASVLADLGVHCSGPAGAAWIDSCGPMVGAPAKLVLACGDGNYYLTNLSWQGWGKGTATAAGTAHLNDCTPYCAAGHFHTYPVRVSATRLSACGAARHYASLTVSYTGKRPKGAKARTTSSLAC